MGAAQGAVSTPKTTENLRTHVLREADARSNQGFRCTPPPLHPRLHMLGAKHFQERCCPSERGPLHGKSANPQMWAREPVSIASSHTSFYRRACSPFIGSHAVPIWLQPNLKTEELLALICGFPPITATASFPTPASRGSESACSTETSSPRSHLPRYQYLHRTASRRFWVSRVSRMERRQPPACTNHQHVVIQTATLFSTATGDLQPHKHHD